MLKTIDEEGKGKPSHEFYFPWRKFRALSLVSATREIEYAVAAFGTFCSAGSLLLLQHRHNGPTHQPGKGCFYKIVKSWNDAFLYFLLLSAIFKPNVDSFL